MNLIQRLFKKKFREMIVDHDEPPNYVQLLLDEKNARINFLMEENSRLRLSFDLNQRETPRTPSAELPQPVARFVPFNAIKKQLEDHYRRRAKDKKAKNA